MDTRPDFRGGRGAVGTTGIDRLGVWRGSVGTIGIDGLGVWRGSGGGDRREEEESEIGRGGKVGSSYKRG